MAWPEKEKIYSAVTSMLEVNLAVQEGETILIMTDPPSLEQWTNLSFDQLSQELERCMLAKMVADLATELIPAADITFLPYPSIERDGAEPDTKTAERMLHKDVIIAITNHSLSNTMAADQACQIGARIASMPGFMPEMFEGPMKANPHLISENSTKIAHLLTEAKTGFLTTPLGTELFLDLEDRSGYVDTGLITAGELHNLPAGEAYIAPIEGKATGKVIVSTSGYPGLKEQMILYFKSGEVSNIEGGGEIGDRLRQLLKLPIPGKYKERRNLAELGIGTNPMARSVEKIIEAEKIMGTVHIGIGDNIQIGGVISADLHIDFILWEPTLSLDEQVIIKEGKWLV